jgi:uncharacterized membrane protein YedE/YeeE
MCFVAGIRDFVLVRDRELLTGFFTFLCTVWVLTSVFYSAGLLERGIPEYQSVKTLSKVEEKAMKLSAEAMEAESDLTAGEEQGREGFRPQLIEGTEERGGVKRGIGNTFMGATVIGGWLLGFLSVFAGGCVLRQHVLGAQGQRNSLFFIFGFYAGSIVFYTLLYRFFDWIY